MLSPSTDIPGYDPKWARRAKKPTSFGGMVVINSGNTKVGRMAATYAPIGSTCSDSCPFFSKDGDPSSGCYAREGKVAMTERRIASGLAGLSDLTIAHLEASAIRDAADVAPKGRTLRGHVSGDCRTVEAAQIFGAACAYWMVRVQAKAYTYTHVHREIPRSAWGPMSVLASVESVEDAIGAMARGYAAAIVVADEHPADGRAYRVPGTDIKIAPCPAQTRGITCDQCGLCFDDAKLLALRLVIAFSAHGPGARKVRAAVRRARMRRAPTDGKRHLTVLR